MEFVCNANYKGESGKSIDLRKLHSALPTSKLCIKPLQLVIKDLRETLILFSNGKYRVMGCIDEFEASFLAFAYLPSDSFPSITLQSYTLKWNLGFHVNLRKMVRDVPCVYEPELFPALRHTECNPVCVNIFSPGKVVVCGLRNPEEMYAMQLNLRRLCKPYKQQLKSVLKRINVDGGDNWKVCEAI